LLKKALAVDRKKWEADLKPVGSTQKHTVRTSDLGEPELEEPMLPNKCDNLKKPSSAFQWPGGLARKV